MQAKPSPAPGAVALSIVEKTLDVQFARLDERIDQIATDRESIEESLSSVGDALAQALGDGFILDDDTRARLEHMQDRVSAALARAERS
jgi:hypothetical protein